MSAGSSRSSSNPIAERSEYQVSPSPLMTQRLIVRSQNDGHGSFPVFPPSSSLDDYDFDHYDGRQQPSRDYPYTSYDNVPVRSQDDYEEVDTAHRPGIAAILQNVKRNAKKEVSRREVAPEKIARKPLSVVKPSVNTTNHGARASIGYKSAPAQNGRVMNSAPKSPGEEDNDDTV